MRIKLIIYFLVFSLLCSAQITTREIVSVEEVSKPILYDSSYFGYTAPRPETIKQYIGQEIYLLPISSDNPYKVYEDFYYKPFIDWDNPYVVEYDNFKNQSIIIIDAGFVSTYGGGLSDQWYLKLLINTKDTIYYVAPYQIYAYNGIAKLPFIMNAFIEKSRRIFMNSTLIVKKEFSTSDINNGENLILREGEKWICVDVTLLNISNAQSKNYTPLTYYMLSLILRNPKGNEVFVNYAKEYYNDFLIFGIYIRPTIDQFYTVEQLENIQLAEEEKIKLEQENEETIELQKQTNIREYGNQFGKLINDHKVIIGMTKDMCELSWEKPLMIDKITTSDGSYEVWQYDYKTFLYFENNILKIIKK